MKAGKLVKGLGMTAIALTLVSACMVGSTLAKYTTAVAGTGNAVVAKWSPQFTDGKDALTENFAINLADTSNNDKVKDTKIAPGTSGGFDIVVGRNGTETAFQYSIAVSNFANKPENLVFYTDTVNKTPIAATDGVYQIVNDKEMVLDASADDTVHVYWEWKYETGNGDTADNKAGEGADLNMTFDIKCTATQMASSVTPAP